MKISICCLVALLPCYLAAQSLLTGTVVDSATGSAIGGASIRIVGTTRGTYTSGAGMFRLPLTQGATTLSVKSIGYKESTITLTGASEVSIKLLPSSVSYRSVNVVADITPEEIIRRAAARTKENAGRIKTIEQTLYNKMKVIVNTPGLDEGKGPQERITETFSKIYDRRDPDPVKRMHVLQRRQTANVAASSNLAVFDQFFDFTAPEIVLIKTRLVTPLSEKAVDEYEYKVLNKRPLGDQLVYELSFEPKSRIFPGFEGTLSIVEGTYQVVAAKFKPTDETAVPFLRGLEFEQRYEKLNDSVWVPMYQQMTAEAGLNIIAGLISVDAHVSAITHVTEVAVNEAIEDSLLHPDTSQIAQSKAQQRTGRVSVSFTNRSAVTTVADDADTNRSEFWETHAFAEPTEEERQIYKRQDSIVRTGDTVKSSGDGGPGSSSGTTFGLFSIGPVGVSVTPIINRSAITGMMYGGEINTEVGYLNVDFGAAFGQQGTKIGMVDARYRLIDNDDVRFDVTASVASSIQTIQQKRTILRRFESLHLSNVLFTDYFDFYRADGSDLGFRIRFDDVAFSVLGGWYRHLNMPVIETVNRTVITSDAGDYQTLEGSFEFGITSFIRQLLGSDAPVSGQVDATWIRETGSKNTFVTTMASVTARIPTFTTGYSPMQFVITASGGLSSFDIPRQFQFDFMRRFPVFGTGTDLMTVPINAYGGTSFASLNADHNFSDMWWRGIGLPTYNGRGIDLIGRFNVAAMQQDGFSIDNGSYYASTNGWYMEAGFGLSRIPTFISDVIYLRFDAMWPVGDIAMPRGSFGWCIGISSPLL